MASQTYNWNTSRGSSFQVERWSWSLRLWGFFAFVLAVLFHWWLYLFFNNFEFAKRMLPPPKISNKQERLTIDPKVLKEQQAVQQIPDVLLPMSKPAVKADFQDIVEMI